MAWWDEAPVVEDDEFWKKAPEVSVPQSEAGESLRPSFLAAGGTLGGLAPIIAGGTRGAAMGAPAGPWGAAAGGLLGAALGGGLGTAAGSLGYDLYRDIRRQFVDDPTEPPSQVERLTRAGKEGAIDTAIGGAVGGLTGRLAKAMGLTPGASGRALREAEDIGVGLGTANVSERGPAKGFTSVFGRLPIVGGGAKRQAERQAGELTKAREELFERVGPSKGAVEISEGIETGARQTFDRFQKNAEVLYTNAERLGARAGPVVDVSTARKAANDALAKITTRPAGVDAVVPARVVSYLEGIAKTPSARFSTVEVRSVDSDLENLLRTTQRETGVTFSEINDVRKALDRSLRTAAKTEPAAKALVRANDFFAKGSKRFETPTAKTIGRVETNIFGRGIQKPGSLNPDELSRVAANVRSPKAISDLGKIAGQGAVRDLTRFRLDNALSGSIIREASGKHTFDPAAFRKALALDKPRSSDYRAMEAMLARSGVTIQQLEKFARVAENVASVELADASTFVARSAMLRGAGGLGSALKGAATAGLGGVASATGDPTGVVGPSVIAAVVLLRTGGSALMKPRMLKSLTTALDDSATVGARRMATVRLLRFAGEALTEEDEPSEQQSQP